ncbi:MAG: sensor histidine kinase [Clostridia bacterium]|nr:sensor histidine kinase [Clostridia bacterium]
MNAILNNKNELAADCGVEMSFSGVVPAQGIENDDLCTVVGNLIDNAIDGAKRAAEKKYIRVKGAVRNGFFTLSVKNAVDGVVEIKNNKIKTTKTDTKRHGIGLKNVAAVAKKYHGAAVFSCDETEFTADVTLQLKEDPEP